MSKKLSVINGLEGAKHKVKCAGYSISEKTNDVCDKVIETLSYGLLKANDKLCEANDVVVRNQKRANFRKRIEYCKSEIALNKVRKQPKKVYVNGIEIGES